MQGTTPNNFTLLDGCTFGFNGEEDPCLDTYKFPLRLGTTYDSSGFAGSMFFKSSASDDGNIGTNTYQLPISNERANSNVTDVFAFGGPVNFRGYFPNYSINATIDHNYWTWALLKGHPRNRAGTVKLRSADPLDTPEILFNFFEDGAENDLQAIYESILLARDSFARQPIPFTEILPGAEVQTYIHLPIYRKPN